MQHILPTRNIKIQKKVVESKKQKQKKNIPSSTLTAYLYDKSRDEDCYKPNSGLIIMDENPAVSNISVDEKYQSFDMKKALKPLVLGTLAVLGGTLGLSYITKSSMKVIKNTKSFEQLPDLAINMNIKQEPQFAAYMMLRNPNAKTALGFVGVSAFSAITLISKNFVDGFKEIWIKKQEADIQRDLQEKLIKTETEQFSGKLQIERNILSKAANHFKKVFDKNTGDSSIYHLSNTFKSFTGFCGAENVVNNDKKKAKDKALSIGAFSLTALATVAVGILTFKNLRKTAEIANEYTNDCSVKIVNQIEKTVAEAKDKAVSAVKKGAEEVASNIKGKATNAAKKAASPLDELKELFKLAATPEETIRRTLKDINVEDSKIDEIVKEVAKDVKSIYADAPEALGGVPKKIQYYCFIDENRGHLYNWIMRPENKFTKYIFLAFTAISSIGYLGKEAVDAVRKIAVAKENSNTEYGLQSRLVDVELKNYKAKKTAAINPLMEEFNKRQANGASKEELQNLADNILMEIKNGPPFVYG